MRKQTNADWRGVDMVDTADQRIAEIKARADAARWGPWEHETQMFDEGPDLVLDDLDEVLVTTSGQGADAWRLAEFIAHAREDVPFLLQIVADLKEQVRYLANPLRHAAYSSAKWDAYLPQGVAKEAAASVALDGGTQFDEGAEAEARQMTPTVPDLGNSTDATPKEDTDNGQ